MLADKESGGSVDIQRLTGFETYRDGGSISASFAGTDGCEYTLMLKVKLGSTATGIVKLGYTPILSKWRPATRSSSAGNFVMTSQPSAVTTSSSSIRAADQPSLAGQ